MGVLLPNYPKENVVRGENVPNFKVNASEGTSASNVFQILQDLHLKQHQDRCTILVPVIVLYLCRTLVSSFTTNLNSTELHLQGVAPRSQYSDPVPEAVTLQ